MQSRHADTIHHGSASLSAVATRERIRTDERPNAMPPFGYPSALELFIATLAIALVAVLLMGDHVLNGGLYTDDWPIAAIHARDGTWQLISNLFLANHARPVGAVYLGIAQGLTGPDGSAHAAVGIGLHVLKCMLLYWLLRRLAMTWWQAGAVSTLVLLFPFADSAWLWFAATQSNLAISLALLGALAALAGLEAEGRRVVGLHATAALLFALSVLTYEIGAALVLLTWLLYRPRTSGRTAVRLWIVDAVVVVAAAVIPRIPGLLPGVTPHESMSLDAQLDHARLLADQAFTLMTSAAVPFGGPHRNVVIPLLALIGAIALACWWWASSGSQQRAELRRWIGWAAAGILIVAAAYVVFVPANPDWYQPMARGSDNRVNAAAAIGYCIVLFSTAKLLGLLVSRSAGGAVAAVAAVLGTAFLAVGYADRVRADVRAWDSAATLQEQQLARLDEVVGGAPPANSTAFVYGGTGRVARGIWSFGVPWDLDSAVRLWWDDPTLHAYPIFVGTTIVCGAGSLYPDGFANGNSAAQTAYYGRIVFADLRSGERLFVRTKRDCLDTARVFQPGPVGP